MCGMVLLLRVKSCNSGYVEIREERQKRFTHTHMIENLVEGGCTPKKGRLSYRRPPRLTRKNRRKKVTKVTVCESRPGERFLRFRAYLP